MTKDQLKEARLKLGLTQVQMADELGMTPRNYQRLEAGDVEIKSAYVKLINMKLEGT